MRSDRLPTIPSGIGTPEPEVTTRRILRVRGIVQGVGFRPFVYRAATELGLHGYVRNDPDGVVIDAEGDDEAFRVLSLRIRTSAPPAARVESIETRSAPFTGFEHFEIRESEESPARSARVSPDLSTCGECVRELLDPENRRFQYTFVNCTDCGPRYSIVRDVPYDRSRTTMAGFELCGSCRAEYDDRSSRRFHAQPNACPSCGPRIWIPESPAGDPIDTIVEALRRGDVAAIKGIGGFHLACDARNDASVMRLRQRKRRPDKPFAVMFPDLTSLEAEAVVAECEREALSSPRSPIVLLRARASSGLASAIHPGLTEIGCFLPYTPLHHRLLSRWGGPLVMTSGNRSEEPIASGNDEALERLRDIADVFLLHDRDIHMRSDDSVIRLLGNREQVMRRARGYVPESIDLPFPPGGPAILAVGADLKNVCCLTSGRGAILSQHIGDLETLEARELAAEVRANLERLFQTRPKVVAHDLHPGYHSTAIALGLGLPAIAVQHHHAHIASCLVDNQRSGSAIGVAWDGTGYGPDGSVWGGEFLVADLRAFERVGRLRPVPLPGGDRAAREPWRMAVSHLLSAGLSAARIDEPRREAIERMIRNGVFPIATSSAGRLFDAVASAASVRQIASYEGQAAMELEAMSETEASDPYLLPVVEDGSLLELDSRPMWREIEEDLVRDRGASRIGGRFHLTLATAIADVCDRIRARTGLSTVALSGGCFQSRLLTTRTVEQLEKRGFETLLHSRVPPGDGGIALGQAAIARARLDASRR